MSFFDTHVHWTHELLWPEHLSWIHKARQANVTDMMMICLSLSDLKKGEELCANERAIYLAAAVHPADPEDKIFEDDIKKYASNGQLNAIGETGIDLFHDTVPLEIQKNRFIRHLRLALKFNLPVIVHVRKALHIVLEILDTHYINEKNARMGVIHCFDGEAEDYRKIVQRNWVIGIGGSITYTRSKATRECMKVVRHCDYVLETDAPFLSPGPKRKLPNHSGNIPDIAEYVASIRGERLEKVEHDTYTNAKQLFGLDLIPS